MDISRPDVARRKKLRRALHAATAVMAIVVLPVGVSRREPAAPRVDRDAVHLDAGAARAAVSRHPALAASREESS